MRASRSTHRLYDASSEQVNHLPSGPSQVPPRAARRQPAETHRPIARFTDAQAERDLPEFGTEGESSEINSDTTFRAAKAAIASSRGRSPRTPSPDEIKPRERRQSLCRRSRGFGLRGATSSVGFTHGYPPPPLSRRRCPQYSTSHSSQHSGAPILILGHATFAIPRLRSGRTFSSPPTPIAPPSRRSTGRASRS